VTATDVVVVASIAAPSLTWGHIERHVHAHVGAGPPQLKMSSTETWRGREGSSLGTDGVEKGHE